MLFDPFIFIGNEMAGKNVRFSVKRKGQYNRIAFSVIAHSFLSYYTVNDVPF